MKTLTEILRHEVVWVNPAHRLRSALLLMRGHDLGGLAVLDGSLLVGMLTYHNLLGQDLNKMVAAVMDTAPTILSAETTLRAAAEIMTRKNAEFLPVVDEENALLGVVSAADLLAELRRPTDPLTELSWSDTLREWAAEKLEKGHEITIIFYDVNDFGKFNKVYGHVVGDTVLRHIAAIMQNNCREEMDCLCRYGGDEFCIATLRGADDAEELAEQIARECAVLHVPEMHERVSVTYGLRGGRRSREREQIHYAATLNNLINLASRDCMARKGEESKSRYEAAEERLHAEAVVQSADYINGENGRSYDVGNRFTILPFSLAQIAENGVQIATLEIREKKNQTTVRVELQSTQAVWETVGAAASGGKSEAHDLTVPLSIFNLRVPHRVDFAERSRLIADATLAALRLVLPEDYELELEEITHHATTDGRPLVTVIGELKTARGTKRLVETVFVGTDADRSIAQAALTAALREIQQIGAAVN